MTARRFLLESLVYYWRAHVAVLLCVAVGTTVLGGALLVGDSMRGSLRDITLDRLGRVDYALRTDRYFREALADELPEVYSHEIQPAGQRAELIAKPKVEPAISVKASISRVQNSGQELERVGRVQVWGVRASFAEFSREPFDESIFLNWDLQTGDGVVLNEALARELAATKGATVLLRMEMPSDIPREAALGRKSDTVRTLRLRVAGVISPSQMGNFGLDPSQRAARNAFVHLNTIQQSLGVPGRANTILVAGPAGKSDPIGRDSTGLQLTLKKSLRLDDLGLSVRVDSDREYVALESRRMLLEPTITDAALRAADEMQVIASPVLTYLANSIKLEQHDQSAEIPYSVVAAVPLDSPTPFRLPPLTTGESLTALADDEILLNTWAADDLGAKTSDRVQLVYFAAEPATPFETATATFRVRGIIPIEGAAADPKLVPKYPGITDAKTYGDWDPPFPMDLKRVRPRDDEYWKEYRTTPKAFVSLAAGEKLWGSRFGEWTSFRVAVAQPEAAEQGRKGERENQDSQNLSPSPALPLSPASRLDQAREQFDRELSNHLRPEQLGLIFQPVKAQGLEASKGGTDFGGLFLAFSFFLIVSAAILIGLVFRLGVERRVKQVGLLLALGFPQADVRMLLLLEGLSVAAVGSVAGLAGAVGYAWLVMAGLRTWWFPAVGTSLLRLHVPPPTLGIGAAAGLVVATLAILISLRGLVRIAPRALLAGSVTESLGRLRSGGRMARWIVWVTIVIALIITYIFIHSQSPVLFFVVGTVLLVALLGFVADRADRGDNRLVRGRGWWAIARLGVRNAYRHRSRSVLTIGLVAFATFVIIAVGANRREGDEPSSHGSAETSYVAESAVPLLHDLNTPAGRRELGLPDDSSFWMSNVRVSGFRVKEGEDASCLNLYQPRRPRILGVSAEAFKGLRFPMARSVADSGNEPRGRGWGILKKDFGEGVVPAIGDANSVRWILHLGLGERLPIVAQDGRTVNLQIVGLLERSIFQSELLISEANFRKLFPSQVGYSYFLIEEGSPASDRPGPYSHAGRDYRSRLPTLLEQHLSDYGFDVTPTADRLAEYHAVENTYLATFQMLGGLGLVLGTLGLGAVLLRSVFERRGELALLLAVGFRPAALAWLVLAETAFLLTAGLAIGTVSALAAVAPHLLQYAGQVPWLSLTGTLICVLAIGLLSAAAAVLATLRTPLLPALRSE